VDDQADDGPAAGDDGSKTARDGANVRMPPPAIYAGAFAAGVVLNFVAPTAKSVSAGGFGDALGAALALAGLGVGTWALLLFGQAGENPLPHTATEQVLTRGPYRFTRNPMYLAMSLVSFGGAFALSNAWLLATTVAAMLLVDVFVIRREEAYLAAKFGGAYTAYKDKVRRWI